MRTLLVVGASWDQSPIIARGKELGWRVVATDFDPTAHGLSLADEARHVSTRDPQGILALAREIRADAITYMITESPMAAIREAATAMGLPAPSAKSVQATMSKPDMRAIFDEGGIEPIPFGRARSREEAVMVAEKVGLPVVMKAADTGGQLGLFRIENLDDVAECFDKAAPLSVANEVIVEAWLEGPEVNGVGVVVNGKLDAFILSDRIKDAEASFGIVQRHLYPADVDPKHAKACYDLCQQAVSAMDIENGIVFPQMIVTERGPFMVEIGERVPGGVMKELYEAATGIDLCALQIAISAGDPIVIDDFRTGVGARAVTVYFLNAEPGPLLPGKVASTEGIEAARAVEGVLHADFYNDPTKAQEIRPLEVARDRFFFIVAKGDTREEAIAASLEGADKVQFLDAKGAKLNTKTFKH